MHDIACVYRSRARVAEGPVWCPEEGALYWVDIYAPAIRRLVVATGETRSWDMPEPVGCVALRRDGGLLVGLRSGFAFVDPASGRVEPILDPEPHRPDNRLNDGRCDRRGRFWVGSMVEGADRAEAALHRLDPDRSCCTVLDGIVISNGLAWSPDDRVMYHADSPRRTVWAYDFDAETGTVRNRRVFVTAPEGEGVPDGAAVDEEGCYWSARYGGGRLVRHAPDGRPIATVELPVKNPTMCAFGGERLDVLYVTSAAGDLSPAELERQPWSGGVLALEVGVRGLPEPRFAG